MILLDKNPLKVAGGDSSKATVLLRSTRASDYLVGGSRYLLLKSSDIEGLR